MDHPSKPRETGSSFVWARYPGPRSQTVVEVDLPVPPSGSLVFTERVPVCRYTIRADSDLGSGQDDTDDVSGVQEGSTERVRQGVAMDPLWSHRGGGFGRARPGRRVCPRGPPPSGPEKRTSGVSGTCRGGRGEGAVVEAGGRAVGGPPGAGARRTVPLSGFNLCRSVNVPSETTRGHPVPSS